MTPYGLTLVVALFACWYYARRRAPRFGIDASHVDLAMPLVFAVSVLGAQILAALAANEAYFIQAAAARMRLSLFALLLFAMPTLYLYCRLSGVPPGRMLDLFALPALAGLMLTRLGCFMAGCCWGDLVRQPVQIADIPDPAMARQVLTLPWLAGDGFIGAMSFPAGSFAWRQQVDLGLISPQAGTSLPVHPTQLYEFLLLAVLIAVLQRRERHWTRPGTTVLAALSGYAALRFFLEFLRADNALAWGPLTGSQLICAALFMVCVVLIGIGRSAGYRPAKADTDKP